MDRAKERETRDMLIKDGYSEVVIEHWLNPGNFGQFKSYDGYSGRITSTSGDAMWVWLRVYDNVTLTLQKSGMPQILGVEGEAVVLYREPSTMRLRRTSAGDAVSSAFPEGK
jgi:hypothetical protein